LIDRSRKKELGQKIRKTEGDREVKIYGSRKQYLSGQKSRERERGRLKRDT